MRVTVCELNHESGDFEQQWQALVAHVHEQRSELVLLPEMIFAPWLAAEKQYDAAKWQQAVKAHDRWLRRADELAPAVVLGSRPVTREDGLRLNEGFILHPQRGYLAAHHKYYLPEEPGYWEASWYGRTGCDFSVHDAGPVRVGFMICTDMWFSEHARAYGKQGAQLILVPRATEQATFDKWLAGARTAAVVSGCFCLSSNRADHVGHLADLGGQGWIIDPDGRVLGTTSPEYPFLTLDIDLDHVQRARTTYPRYVQE